MLGQQSPRVWPEPASGEARNQTDRLLLSCEDDVTAPDGVTHAPDSAADTVVLVALAANSPVQANVPATAFPNIKH
jgi:hypothetical protein